MNLETSIKQLPRVGKAAAQKLSRLGIETVKDLLYYFPFRYEDFAQIVPIRQVVDGQSVTVSGRVELIGNRRTHRKHIIITEALVSDATGSIRVVWFNQPFLTKSLAAGDEVYLSGVVKGDMLGAQLVSPSYEKATTSEAVHTGRLVPMYHLTEGLTEKQLRTLVKHVLPLASAMEEWLPERIVEEYDLAPMNSALAGIHFPESQEHLKASVDRLKFDELFLVQLQAELTRLENVISEAPVLAFKEEAIKQFVKELPFPLTNAQKVATWEILKDIAKPVPMNRMLSGDVGSGKTIVAAIVLYNAALNAMQSALMAPTEILAEQHLQSLRKVLPSVRVALYTRTHRRIAQDETEETVSKKEMLRRIEMGEVDIVVGTQALLSEGVIFKTLGIVVVDEQHRFGVMQRKVIKEKGRGVHFLSMTATPIPRSLGLMIYGDLDLSVINELPPGRKKIITRLVEPVNRPRAYTFIEEQIKQGRQAFVICPLIENTTDKNADKKSVIAEYEKLSKKIFPHLRVGYLHGKMKAEEKDSIMNAFKNHELDILVSTSVIEVGVNVPNATVMMIEGADRFGLAQLHQFRGRVGRSDFQSYCLLFTDSDSQTVRERLSYFEAHHDGFALAEKDLELRGPGEVYGTSQSGMMQLQLATLMDRELIRKARAAAKAVAPDIAKYPRVQEKIVRMQKIIHLE